jgi:DUF971 family protein
LSLTLYDLNNLDIALIYLRVFKCQGAFLLNMTTGSVSPPKRIRVDRQAGFFEIAWDDAEGRIALSQMRRSCPCALCDDLRAQQTQISGLRMIADAEMPSAVLTNVIAVGNYAVQLRWEDGHDTGIYTYAFLRELIGAKLDLSDRQ